MQPCSWVSSVSFESVCLFWFGGNQSALVWLCAKCLQINPNLIQLQMCPIPNPKTVLMFFFFFAFILICGIEVCAADFNHCAPGHKSHLNVHHFGFNLAPAPGHQVHHLAVGQKQVTQMEPW